MSILPPLLLSARLDDIQNDQYWMEDDGTGDPWIGSPYSFTATINVEVTTHSSHLTPTPFYYTIDDVKVGNWIASSPGGGALKITAILNKSGSILTCTLEDVDRFNTFTDPYQSGAGGIASGMGYIFEVNDEGMPILMGVPSNILPASFQTDLISRFEYRNVFKNQIRVNQPNHGLVDGDMIFLDVDGDYKGIIADQENADNLQKIVGQVNSVGTPGLEWFTFAPRGQYKSNIQPALPDSLPGSLIYIDDSVAGKLTATKPTTNAIAAYIRLNANNEGIYLLGGSGGGGSGETGPLGYYASVYRVADISARDALDNTPIQLGDQVYVADAGGGEWAHYIASSKTSGVVTWTQLVDQDSSTVDGRTISIEYEIGSPQDSVDIYSVSPTTRVTLVTVEVITEFNTTASLTIGDEDDIDRLVDNDLLDLSTTGTYTVTPSYQFGGAGETMVRAYFSPGTSTQGKAKVTISYI